MTNGLRTALPVCACAIIAAFGVAAYQPPVPAALTVAEPKPILATVDVPPPEAPADLAGFDDVATLPQVPEDLSPFFVPRQTLHSAFETVGAAAEAADSTIAQPNGAAGRIEAAIRQGALRRDSSLHTVAILPPTRPTFLPATRAMPARGFPGGSSPTSDLGSDAAEMPAVADLPPAASGSAATAFGFGEAEPFAPTGDAQVGLASWYGPGFHGRRTASGERFNQNALTAAHRSLPFGTRVRVIDPRSGRSIVVRINDRGPFGHGGRIIDLSKGSARALGLLSTSRVRIVALD